MPKPKEKPKEKILVDFTDLRKGIDENLEKFDALIEEIQKQRDKIRLEIEKKIE